MNEAEKEILKKIINFPKGLLSPAEVKNVIANRDSKSVENLVVKKYLEEVAIDKQAYNGNFYKINFYRVTEKGLYFFDSWYKKFWQIVKENVRTVIVAMITTLLTTVILNCLDKLYE